MSLLRHRAPGECDLGHLQGVLDEARLERDELRERNRRLAGEVANLRAERDHLLAMLHGRTP